MNELPIVQFNSCERCHKSFGVNVHNLTLAWCPDCAHKHWVEAMKKMCEGENHWRK